MSSSSWVVVPTGESLDFQEIMIEETLNGTEIKKCVDSNTESENFNSENIVKESNLSSAALRGRLFQQQPVQENSTSKRSKKCKNILTIPISFSGNSNPLQNVDLENQYDEEVIEDSYDRVDEDQSEATKDEIAKYDITFGERKYSFKSQQKPQTIIGVKIDELSKLVLSDLNIDGFIKLELCKLLKNQTLKRINHVITSEKEYVLFHGEYYPAHPDCVQSEECLIKVFRLPEQEYHIPLMSARNINFSKARNRKVMKSLTLQEYKKYLNLLAKEEVENLVLLDRIGILSPKVIYAKDNILIRTYLGEHGDSVPTLKYAQLTSEEYTALYRQVVNAITTLYREAKLIFGNFTEKNIIVFNNQWYFRFIGRPVELSHNEASAYLMADCRNIFRMFTLKHVEDVIPPEKLFIEISGCDYNDKMKWVEVTQALLPKLLADTK